MLLLCNFIVPQMLWSKRLRRNIPVVFIVCMFVNVGMWLERFVIIVTSLHRDFLPVVVGDVLPDDLGLHDAGRHDRPVHDADVRVRPACCR